MDGLKLDEVARRARVSPRTVRYYIQRGLLPPPHFRGPDTSYDDDHLVRLRVIRKLQDDYWPLEAIASAIAGKTTDELRPIAEGTRTLAPPHGSVTSDVAVPTSNAPSMREARGTRIELAPGLSLFLDDDAPAEARALCTAIRALPVSTRKRERGNP